MKETYFCTGQQRVESSTQITYFLVTIRPRSYGYDLSSAHVVVQPYAERPLCFTLYYRFMDNNEFKKGAFYYNLVELKKIEPGALWRYNGTEMILVDRDQLISLFPNAGDFKES